MISECVTGFSTNQACYHLYPLIYKPALICTLKGLRWYSLISLLSWGRFHYCSKISPVSSHTSLLICQDWPYVSLWPVNCKPKGCVFHPSRSFKIQVLVLCSLFPLLEDWQCSRQRLLLSVWGLVWR